MDQYTKSALLSNLTFMLDNITQKESERIEFALDIIYGNLDGMSKAKMKKLRKDLVDLIEDVDATLA